MSATAVLVLAGGSLWAAGSVALAATFGRVTRARDRQRPRRPFTLGGSDQQRHATHEREHAEQPERVAA